MKQEKMFYSRYFNCSEIIMVAKLIDYKIDYKQFFCQAGFCYKYDNEKLEISPNFMNADTLLNDYFGIKRVTFRNYKSEEYMEIIKDLLNKDEKPVIKVDSFYLPYCLSYKTGHFSHAIEIYQEIEDEFLIKDYFYQYNGKIMKNDLLNAIKSIEKNIQHKICEVYYLEKSEEIMNNNLLENINLNNFQVMNGKRIFDLVEKKDLIIGIKGIVELRKNIIKQINNRNEEFLRNAYPLIKNIANSRRRLYDYFSVDDREIADLYFNNFQNWSVFMNLILKLIASKEYNKNLPRIEKRLNQIINGEQQFLDYHI
ncbi:hypothetical protein [Oceanobacillus sp. CFH 90083]|uniref:hypothetical protein n=1 Tax=Oceanobacillus sp. CFH 90083 TaxID=2592336 RepID=UPI00128DB8E1|nr:hypothetical protein [Oceanobacillus sp. CFH 90083]